MLHWIPLALIETLCAFVCVFVCESCTFLPCLLAASSPSLSAGYRLLSSVQLLAPSSFFHCCYINYFETISTWRCNECAHKKGARFFPPNSGKWDES